MNKPQFKIHGKERRDLKKELSALKAYVRGFWHFHQLDKDMYDIYGCNGKNSLMSNKDATIKFNEAKRQIESIEKQLKEPY